MNIHAHTRPHTHTHPPPTHTSISEYIYMYMYIYIYTHTFTHTYIIYIHEYVIILHMMCTYRLYNDSDHHGWKNTSDAANTSLDIVLTKKMSNRPAFRGFGFGVRKKANKNAGSGLGMMNRLDSPNGKVFSCIQPIKKYTVCFSHYSFT